MRRYPESIFLPVLFLLPIIFLVAYAQPHRDYTPPVALLPDDFESEYPLEVVIQGDYLNGTGDVVDLVWNQTSGPMVENVTEYGTQLNFTPSAQGLYVFTFRVIDEFSNSSNTAKINVTVVPNHPPVIISHDHVINITEDEDVEIDISQMVSDPDEELTFNLNKNGSGIVINPLGYGSYQLIPKEDLSGELRISFDITDGYENTVTLELGINIIAVPDQPRFTEINGEEILIGTHAMEALEDMRTWFNFSWNDPDLLYEGDAVALSCDSSRIIINGSSAWFTPVQSDVGTMVMIFTITDSYGLMDNLSVVLDVVEVNDPPTLVVNGMVPDLEAGSERKINFTGSSDPDDLTLSFFVKVDSGNWVEIQNFYIMSFDTEGLHEVWFKVSDGKGGYDTNYFTVNVSGFISDDDDGPESDDDGGGPDNEGRQSDSWMDKYAMTLLLAIPIIILVGIIVLLVTLAFKKQDRTLDKVEDYSDDETETTEADDEEIMDWDE